MIDFLELAIICFSLLGLLACFYLIMAVCDNHLVPTVEVFIKQFDVPETVAAVTLVAFGSASPELLLNSIAAAQKTSDMSMSAILGSAMIAFGLIPPLCLLATAHSEIKLTAFPIIRETSFYVAGLCVVLFAIRDKSISTSEAFLITFVYITYVSTVVGMYVFCNDKNLKCKVENEIDDSVSEVEIRYTSVKAESTNDDENIEDGTESNEKSKKIGTDKEKIKDRMNIVDLEEGNKRERENSNDSNKNENEDEDEDEKQNKSHIARFSRTVDKLIAFIIPTLTPSASFVNSTTLDNENVPKRSSFLNRISHRHVYEKVGLIGDTEMDECDTKNENTNTIIGHNNEANSSGNNDDSGKNDINVDNSNINTTVKTSNLIEINKLNTNNNIENDDTYENSTNSSYARTTHVPLWRAIASLIFCLFYIGGLATIIVELCKSLSDIVGVGGSTVGATLVAMGSEIPDVISSMALAKKGYYDGAMSGAIGSQVINISLGIGLPALFVCLTGNGFFHIGQDQTNTLNLLTGLVGFVIFTYIIVTVPLFHYMRGDWASNKHASVTNRGSKIQLVVWVVSYLIFFAVNEL